MMNGMGGLIEIVLVLSLVLGWGFIEFRSNRRYRKQAEEQAAQSSSVKRSETGEGDRA